MARLRIKLRKKLWLTLFAEPGHEKRALARLLSCLAEARQNTHIMNTLGYKSSGLIGGASQELDGKVVWSVRLSWAVMCTTQQYLEIYDWLSPIVFQAARREGTFAALRELLPKTAR
jgi:hypothetical protein